MRSRRTIFLIGLCIFIALLAVLLNDEPAINESESNAPVLPAFASPTPITGPLTIKLASGESVTLTDGNRYIWIKFLGNEAGYGRWTCINNNPKHENECYASDQEAHLVSFVWGANMIGYAKGGDGIVHMDARWRVIP
jgi:hypothetical protein